MADSDEENTQADDFEFALTPAKAMAGEVLNYQSKAGKKYWKEATEKLDEEGFDCTPEGLFAFLKSLEDRAYLCDWDDEDAGIIMIDLDPMDPDSEKRNLITEYGNISMEQIRTNEDAQRESMVKP